MKSVKLPLLLWLLLTLMYTSLVAQTWVTSINKDASDGSGPIAVDGVGNVYSGGKDYNNAVLSRINNAGAVQWTLHLKGVLTLCDINAITLDNTGNIYLTGHFSGPVNFNPNGTAMIGSGGGGNGDMFIARYNSSGICQWVRAIGGSGYDEGLAIKLDPDGNVIVAGIYTDKQDEKVNFATAGSGYYLYGRDEDIAGGKNGFYAKYNSSGDLVWAYDIYSITNDQKDDPLSDERVTAIYIKNARLYISGAYSAGNGLDFGGNQMKIVEPPTGTTDLFFGNVELVTGVYDGSSFAHRIGGAGIGNNVSPSEILVDAGGSMYICASLKGSADFDIGTLVRMHYSGGNGSIVLFKYDNAINYNWGVTLGNSGITSGGVASFSMCMQPMSGTNSKIYISGFFDGTNGINVGTTLGSPIIIAKKGNRDAFYVKYDQDGIPEWVQTIGASGQTVAATSIDYKAFHSGLHYLYLSGVYNGTVNFNNGGTSSYSNTSIDASDIFVAKYEAGTGVLPVTLSKLSAHYLDDKVELKWHTTSEINNKGFNIQKKQGESWRNIGFVPVKNSASLNLDYTFTDIPKEAATIYYRLEQVDLDGKTSVSNVVKVDIGGLDFNFECLPNPATTNLTVTYLLPQTEIVSLKLVSSTGTLIKVLNDKKQNAGTYTYPIEVNTLKKGVYYFVLQTSKEKRTLKLVVN